MENSTTESQAPFTLGWEGTGGGEEIESSEMTRQQKADYMTPLNA